MEYIFETLYMQVDIPIPQTAAFEFCDAAVMNLLVLPIMKHLTLEQVGS